MNHYIDAQCRNMVAITSTFQQACEVAALRGDNEVSKEEAKLLKRISAASDKFKSELKRIIST